MNEQLKKIVDPVRNLWAKMTKKARIILFSVLGAVVVVAIGFGIVLNTQPYVILYPGMDGDEAVQVMNELRSRNVDYKETGGTIYVPKDQENALRMELSNLGYPRTAPNYDFFLNNIDIMTTDYEKKTIEKYQLNQRLESVIKTLDPVRDASVTINIPDNGGYVWEQNKEEPSASVTLTLKSGQELETSQVNGIKRLISTSGPAGLKLENVAVIDAATGSELDGTTNTQTDISQLKMDIERQYENSVTKKIQNQLGASFGPGNFSVAVKSTVDLDKKLKEITTYLPSKDDNNTGVVSRHGSLQESTTAGDAAGGIAGAETNTEEDPATYPNVTTDGDKIYAKDQNDYEYLVSKVIEQIQNDAGTLQDMTISVVINETAMTPQEKNGTDGIKEMVAYAAGTTTDKVSVFSREFPTQPVVANTTGLSPMIMILGGVVLGLLFILFLVSFLVARKRKKRLLQMAGLAETLPEPGMEGFEGLAAGEQEPVFVPDIQSKRDSMGNEEEQLQKEIQDFSHENPEIVAQLVRTLLRGEESNE